MKKILSLFMTLVILSSLFSVFPVSTGASDAPAYIKSFQLGVAEITEEAESFAQSNGYTLLEGELWGGIQVDEVALAYISTSNADEAIRDVVILEGGDEDAPAWINPQNNCKYYAVGGYVAEKSNLAKAVYKNAVDINSGALTSCYLYIYVTYDKNAGAPITDPVIVYNEDKYTGRTSYAKYDDGTIADLNKSVSFSKDVYLYYNQFTYYSGLQLGADHWDDVAKEQATQNGYQLVSSLDLNDADGNTRDFVYLAGKQTDDKTEAITDIVCLIGREYETVTSWVNTSNGCTYYPVGGYDDDNNYVNALNTNFDTDGEYLYLFYTCDLNAGDPVIALSVNYQLAESWETVLYSNGNPANLNYRSGGNLIYLLYKRTFEYTPIVYYVESFQLGTAWDQETAKECATEDGYVLVGDVDLNNGALFSDDVYLGYKTTLDSTKAIRDIIAVDDEDYTGQYTLVNKKNGCTYYSVGGYDEGVYKKQIDAKEDSGGDYIYLYVTTDEKAGEPIINPVLIFNNSEYSERSSYLRNYPDGDLQDLNQGTTSMDYIYLYYDQISYYSSFILGSGEEESDAKRNAMLDDYELLSGKDLNDNAGGDYIFMGYKKTSDAALAVRDIICLNGAEYNVDSWVNPANNCTYYPVGGQRTDDDGNSRYFNPMSVNYDAGGDFLFLFYTTDENAGEPITNIIFSYDSSKDGWTTVKFQDGEEADLNSDAGGDYIYMLFMQQDVVSKYGSIFGDGNIWLFIGAGAVIIVGIILGITLTKKHNTAIPA